MRKLMMGLKVGLFVVGLLAMVATPAMAQFSDPLTLATSGVLLPFFGTLGQISILETAAPVDDIPLGHMVFFDSTCVRLESRPLPLTTNDVDVRVVAAPSGIVPVVNKDGLVAIANTTDQITLIPLRGFPFDEALHSRMYVIDAANSKFRVLEPIILDTYELPSSFSTWVPIRTGATFFAPHESPTGLQTILTLICPKNTIYGPAASGFVSTLFAAPTPNGLPSTAATANFKSAYPVGSLVGVIYDEDENPLGDILISCDCLTTKTLSGAGAISTVYAGWPFGTYTEIITDGTYAGFTGYKALTAVGAPAVDFHGRLSNGNRLSITSPAQTTCGAAFVFGCR